MISIDLTIKLSEEKLGTVQKALSRSVVPNGPPPHAPQINYMGLFSLI